MSEQHKKIRIGILGASGYTGAELLRLLVRHPAAEIAFLTAERHAGAPIESTFPHLFGHDLPVPVSVDDIEWAGAEIDLVFCALPHGTTQEIIKGLLHATGHTALDEMIVERREDLIAAMPGKVRVVDLSADFRLDNVDTYAEWYGHPHYAPELQPMAVYGLPELYRDRIRTARLVANPGCYPTAALLALVPPVESGMIERDDIIIDAKSGVTGAGRALKETSLFAEVAEGAHAYGVASHRHGPEIDQELSKAAGRPLVVNFTPHLMPMNRGELITAYVRLTGGASADDLRAALAERYAEEPFVTVAPAGMSPATRHVRGSNHCVIGVFADRIEGRAIVLSAIDNLTKGSSGEAIQNMNIMYGLPETMGLEQAPLFP